MKDSVAAYKILLGSLLCDQLLTRPHNTGLALSKRQSGYYRSGCRAWGSKQGSGLVRPASWLAPWACPSPGWRHVPSIKHPCVFSSLLVNCLLVAGFFLDASTFLPQLDLEFNSLAEVEQFWARIPPEGHRAWIQRAQASLCAQPEYVTDHAVAYIEDVGIAPALFTMQNSNGLPVRFSVGSRGLTKIESGILKVQLEESWCISQDSLRTLWSGHCRTTSWMARQSGASTTSTQSMAPAKVIWSAHRNWQNHRRGALRASGAPPQPAR